MTKSNGSGQQHRLNKLPDRRTRVIRKEGEGLLYVDERISDDDLEHLAKTAAGNGMPRNFVRALREAATIIARRNA